eukprot:scaffold20060_cov73-Skeletonema_marinoi.AAC.2
MELWLASCIERHGGEGTADGHSMDVIAVFMKRGRLKEQKRVYLLEELSPSIELAVALGR